MRRLTQFLTSLDAASLVLLVSLAALLGAGLDNVAHGFADVKVGSPAWVHWGAAAAIELGLFAIGLTLAVLARAHRPNRRLVVGLLIFVAASAFANMDASLKSLTGANVTLMRLQAVDGWVLLKAGLLGGAIPLMVLLVIEALRSLAEADRPRADAVAASERAHIPQGARGAPNTHSDDRRNGHAVSHLADPRRATLTDMEQIIAGEPHVGATELARRLNVARGTVYRWRDRLEANRVDEA